MADPVPAVPIPDDKDWTWVLDSPCPDCGFDARAITGADVAGLVLETIPRWQHALTDVRARSRPAPEIWSPLEYGCHIRDVFVLFGQRAQLLLDQDDPLFANWDQDETALAERYWEQSPSVVAVELAAAGRHTATIFAGVEPGQWARAGRRSNGSTFTVDSLGRYFIHDVLHHLVDVGA
jgi:hypothetical protein